MNRSFSRLASIASLGALALLTGCQSLSPTARLGNFNDLYQGGLYQQAADSALAHSKGLLPDSPPELLWSLQAGVALTASGQFAQSNRVLDIAEELAQAEDTESFGRKGMEFLTSTLVNNNLNRYSPTVYDGVMVNTYKALNNIFLEDTQNARIEFNRAADRQRRAEEQFRKRIAAEKDKREEQQAKASKDVKDAESPLQLEKSRIAAQESVFEAYPELEEWAVYPDYVNPYTDYLHGLYFLFASADRADYGKARDSLRRVAGMNPKNTAVKTDLMVIDKLMRGEWRKQNLSPAVWVIFENGLGPEIEEDLLPIPLFMVSDKVEYAQIALPRLTLREQAYPHLELYSGSRRLASTQQLASLDRVIQTEFKIDFPYRMTEAIAGTLAKGVIQHQAREQMGPAGSLIAAVYQVATTRADTRIWSALPKDVQVARLRRPADRKLTVNAPGLASPLTVELPDRQFSVLYIKATSAGTAPVYQVAGFGS